MKNRLHLPALLILSAAFATAQMAPASQELWQGVSGTSTTTNWSDTANWSGGLTPNGNDLFFANTGAASASNVVNSVVDQNLLNPASLTFTNNSFWITGPSSYYHTVLIPAGINVTNAGALTVGIANSSIGNYLTWVTFTGGGSLVQNGTTMTVDNSTSAGAAGTNAVLDLSGLSNFVATALTTLNIAGSGSEARGEGTLTLAQSNSITATTISMNTSGGNPASVGGTINLGLTTNIINVGTFVVGQTKGSVNKVQFLGSTGGLRIRGANGNSDDSSRATLTLGDRNNTGSGTTSGSFLFVGHPVDIKAGTLTIGQDRSSSTSATHGGSGVLQFDTGVVDATTVVMAACTTGDPGAPSATGTLQVGGGTFIAGSGGISMANRANGTATGTLIITNGGTVICSNNIFKATSAGTASIVISNGTLRVDGTIGSATAGIDNLSISNATLALNIPASGVPVLVTNLSIGGTTNKINIGTNLAALVAYPTTLPVIKYTAGNGTNTANFNIGMGTLPNAFTGFISNDVANSSVDVVITGGPALPRQLIWNGRNPDAGNALTSTWDINATRDWFSNAVAVFYNDNGGSGGDIVALTDGGATNRVTLAANVSPSAINVTNNNFDYTINDNNAGYAIGGVGILNKQGSRTLLIDNSGSNTFSGGVIIGSGTVQVGNNDGNGNLGNGAVTDNGALVFNRNSALNVGNAISGAGTIAINSGTVNLAGGNTFTGAVSVASGATLQAGNNSALGTTNGWTTVANGGTLDVNAHNVGQEQVYISGNGVLNDDTTVNGAIINSSAAGIFPAVQRLTLQGDTVFGCPTEGALACSSVLSNRWDLRSSSTGDANGASLSTGGNAYNLTKVGLNQVSIVGVTVDPALGNIDIQNGLLSIETATTSLGDPAKTLTVENGATLSMFNATNRFNKNIVLDGNGVNNNLGTVNSSSGNNTIGGPVTLNGDVQITFRNANGNAAGGSLTFSNTTPGLAGTGSLTKNDTNTLTIVGLDVHSGGTIVNDGTFILNGMSTDSANTLTVNTHTLGVPTILGGNGTNKAPVTINDTLWPGAGGTPSTFGAGSGSGTALQFSVAEFAIFSLGTNNTVGGGVNDLLNVSGNFDPENSFVQINPIGVLKTNAPYTLVKFSGSRVSTFNGSANTAVQSRYSFSLDQSDATSPNMVRLTVSGQPASLVWDNAANSGLWDINNSQNWSNTVSQAAADKFYSYDTVLMDDSVNNSATPTNIITIATNTAVVPQAITVNATINYSIVGPGKISGPTTLTKLGSGVLTLAAPNDFTGNTTIQAGAVAITNSASLGASSGTVYVTNGASLYLTPATTNNGVNFGQKPFVISGAGVGGNGVIFNGGTNQQNAFQNVTMAGDATFGGTARWDIRSPANTNAGATLSTGGQPFKLTKAGSNFIALSSVDVDPALGDIDVQAGTLSAETQTTSLGNPANTLTVETGARFELWNNTNILSKVLVLNDGTILTNGSGSNTFAGPVTLQGNPLIGVGGVGLVLPNVISGASAGLMKGGAATLYLAATNTYTGNTTISNGTVALVGTGSIATSPNVTVPSGATLDVTGRADDTFTLASGQTLLGKGAINGNLTNLLGVISLLGTNGTFTVTSNAVLGGVFTNQLGQGSNTVFIASSNLVYGGTLVVTTNPATITPLTAGTHYRLFKSANISGTFSSVTLPALGPSLGWTNGLAVDGTIGIVTTVIVPNVPAKIQNFGLLGGNVSISGTNAVNGGTYYVLMTTNLALPVGQWTPVSTNVVNTNGATGNGFSLTGTNVVFPNGLQQFYILSNTN